MTSRQRLYRRAANAALRGQCWATLSAEMPYGEFIKLWEHMEVLRPTAMGFPSIIEHWERRYIFLMLLSHEKIKRSHPVKAES